ncbi:PREDICTED: sciellin isoform X3 [Chinchilla lanigera]|uniref:sciellin isoform X3 n=1 Tax=Chinchilla lanigera TaxID=34839 RepID=UPI00038EF583|nr:PREDICTED: sciellin isoform X3 [Chinchilla lanigera]
MSTNLPLRKKTSTGNDMKSTTRRTVLKQEASHDLNKRRTFLQDNSWIKKRPEEEKDENYGKVVLNRHNSHDALHRKINDKDEPKAVISRYRSDDTLDRISDRNDAANTSKANTLDNRLTNRSISTFRSSDATKSQPGSLLSVNTSHATGLTRAASPVKKKRQSWFPPPPPGHSTTPSTEASRRNPTVHPPIPPKPSSPVASPKQLRQENRQISPPKLGISTETKRSTERSIRTQDLDDIIKVATSLQKTNKGKELDNIIKMNKSLNRNQGLDGLFRANRKAEQTEKRAKSLESLIHVNTQMDKDGKESRDLESITKEDTRTDGTRRGKQGFAELVRVNPETNKNIKSQSLGNLIEVSPQGNRNRQGGQSLDCLIKVVPEMNQGDQDLDNLIKVSTSANKSSEQSLDEFINVNTKAVKNTAGNEDFDKQTTVNVKIITNNQRNRDLDNLIKVNPSVTRSNQSLDLDNLVQVKPSALRNVNRYQDPENLTEVNSHMSENKNESSSTGTRYVRPKDTVMYTRTYIENSELPKDGYQNSSGKYIQTVYSTSDRSVIERDMCTYCRKPLGVETKMILDELQICCHSTCFKCEICKQPLENLKAGDSIWIYRQTIHCEPCYSKVMAKWIQ